MTNENQAAASATVSAKAGWVKPEIVSFVPAVESKGNGQTVTDDGGINNLS